MNEYYTDEGDGARHPELSAWRQVSAKLPKIPFYGESSHPVLFDRKVETPLYGYLGHYGDVA